MEVNPVPQRGCLYWVGIPGERTGKKRPALVISIDARNRYASDVLVVPASTVQRGAPTHVRLRKGEGGVRRECVLKCEQITTLSKELLSERALGGELSGRILEQVERGVLRSIGISID
jgi:mRNA interferase MazF